MLLYIIGDDMEDLMKSLNAFRLILGIWFAAILFTAVMFTFSLIYEVEITLLLSGITGVLSLIGIIYSGYSIIKIKNSIRYFKEKYNN